MSKLQPEQAKTVRERLLLTSETINPAAVVQVIRDTVPTISPIGLIDSADEILAQTIGFGPIEKLISKTGVTDVLVNSFSEVWIDQGAGLERVDVAWESETELREFAARLAASVNRRLDDVNPFVDAKLKNGIRFHAIIPPLASRGTAMSFRIPTQNSFSIDDLIELGTFDRTIAAILRRIIKNKLSFAISGNTGSGKTTVLSALLSEVDEHDRILVIEDSSELKINHRHMIGLQARNSNAEGVGQIELAQLIKQSLRMRPDRIVIGEVRGTEVLDLLIALNTGHEGGCVTLHANSTHAVISRIEALGLLAKIPKAAIHSLLKQAIQVLLHVERTKSGRKLTEISLLVENDQGNLQVLPALDLINQKKFQPGWDRLQELIKL